MSRAPLVLSAALSLALPAAAQFSISEISAAAKNPAAFTIDEDSIQLTEIGPIAAPTPLPSSSEFPNDPLVVVDHIINIGERLWKFMLDNQAVAISTTQYATALPEGVRHWASMERWGRPKGTLYALTAKNGYGATVVDLRYMVLRTSGGSYEGKGKYLTAVSAQTMPMSPTWGYRVTLEAAAPDSGIVNAGTRAEPLAAMTFNVAWKIETPIKKMLGTSVYYLRGDGVFERIGGPFALGGSEKAKAGVAKLREETLRLGL